MNRVHGEDKPRFIQTEGGLGLYDPKKDVVLHPPCIEDLRSLHAFLVGRGREMEAENILIDAANQEAPVTRMRESAMIVPERLVSSMRGIPC